MLCFIIPLLILLISFSKKSSSAAPDDDDISFPVILQNTHQTKIAGRVKINPTDTYSSFNSRIGQLINVHPDNIQSSYLMEMAIPTDISPFKVTYKAAISESTDFSLVSQQKDCFFLVNVRPPHVSDDHQNPTLASGFINKVQESQSPMNNETVVAANVESSASASDIHVQEREREERSPRVITQSGVFEECDNIGAADHEFHCSKLDAIVVDGYRTKFGPIGPRKIEPENVQDGLYKLFGPIPDADSNSK